MSDSRNNPVDWFEIYVQDVRRAKVFYESVLGTQSTKLAGSRTATACLGKWCRPRYWK